MKLWYSELQTCEYQEDFWFEVEDEDVKDYLIDNCCNGEEKDQLNGEDWKFYFEDIADKYEDQIKDQWYEDAEDAYNEWFKELEEDYETEDQFQRDMDSWWRATR